MRADKAAPKSGGVKNTPPKLVPTLAETGIDKNLAKEGRKLGSLSNREFEKAVSTARDAVGSVIKTALRTDDKAERRAAREAELASKITALPDKRYGVIVADPEWHSGAVVASKPEWIVLPIIIIRPASPR